LLQSDNKSNPLNNDPITVIIHAMGGHVLEEVQVNVALGNTIKITSVIVADRMRHDLGDVRSLANSIEKHGLIQPIVIARNYRLIAGGRRHAALLLLKRDQLVHGQDYVFKDELDPVRLMAMEIEENLKRKELTWVEEILGKKRLFEIMQKLLGDGPGFGAGKSGPHSGFSLRAMASMLGENPSTTSRDIELAGFVEKHPALASMPTRADAQRKLGVAVTVAAMQIQAKKSVVTTAHNSGETAANRASTTVGVGSATSGSGDAGPTPPVSERWTLYEGAFQNNIPTVPDSSVDLVLTDLPYNIGLGSSSAAHGAGLGQFSDSDLNIVELCADVAVASYRVLQDNRFGVFFYGMGYHDVLYSALVTAGFTVDPYPFIWLRDRTAPPDGFARYSKSYDPALIASKGVPRFLRPNLSNSLALPSVRGPERLHAAQKPVGIMEKFILDMTTPDCVVLDMFAGAGTTGEAALRAKRKAILFELEPANCVLIRSRLGVL
jgi:DNA modification methylase